MPLVALAVDAGACIPRTPSHEVPRMMKGWPPEGIARFGPARRDPEFRAVLTRLARTGMAVGAGLGVVAVLLYLVLNVVAAGERLGWTYEDRQTVALWDKALLLVLCGLAFGLARWLSLAGARLLMAVLVVVAAVASVGDDVLSGDTSFAPGYLTFIYLLAVMAVPYRPLQTAGLGIAVMGALYGTVEVLPGVFGVPDVSHERGHFIYLTMITVTLAGVSGLLYAVRYEQHQAHIREREQAREIERAYHRLEEAHAHLRETQQQLIHSEKMASLGALTAGIAHEIKNPLNFVTNFAALSADLVDDLREELGADASAEIEALLADLAFNASKIQEHGWRADSIVRAMMQHAQAGDGQRETVRLDRLVGEYVDLAQHSRRAQRPDFDVEVDQQLAAGDVWVRVIPQEIGRVLLNLLENAFDAVSARDAEREAAYRPRVCVSTEWQGDRVAVRVLDNGPGVAEDIRERLFEPFVTTKPAGSGTGLGLSLSYDIITQGHGGTLSLEPAAAGRGAAFLATLPVAVTPEAPDSPPG